MNSLSQELASFVIETKFDDLPEAVVRETKRTLLDSIGCAIAGIAVDKGKISIMLARRLGGPRESSILGTGDKVSCSNAAFANAELINALDYDTVLVPGGHVSPYVIPAPLALAESMKASGEDVILATALGHEVSARLSRGLASSLRIGQKEPDGKSTQPAPPVYGMGHCIFGGVAGISKILKLDHKTVTYALGIAGHICPVPTSRKHVEGVSSPMTKYGSAGWVSAAEVTAALLAEMGYTGDTTVFDGDYGFWRFYGAERWKPDAVMDEIGETWLFSEI